MSIDRAVSLAPSATATLGALGATSSLVGVTRHCEIRGPESVGGGDDGGSVDDGGGGDDREDREDDSCGKCDPPAVLGGWPDPDLDAVAALEPDVVLTCDALQRETAAALRERGLAVAHAEPSRLADVFEYVETVGGAVDERTAGERLAADLRGRVERVRSAVPDGGGRPVVYAEEWADPPMAAGNWVPEAVAAAGGRCPLVDPGDRSRAVGREAVEAADPDHVVLHPCGHGERGDAEAFAERGWAVDATVHAVDDSLLNQPSPRLVDGVETLAELLHGVTVG